MRNSEVVFMNNVYSIFCFSFSTGLFFSDRNSFVQTEESCIVYNTGLLLSIWLHIHSFFVITANTFLRTDFKSMRINLYKTGLEKRRNILGISS